MRVINLWAGPGTGKSTTAAGVFHLLKLRENIKVEYVQEYAKDVAWERNERQLSDQIFVTASQNHRLHRLLDHGLEYAIVDSPLLLGLVFKDPNYFKNFEPLALEMFNSYDNINIFLTRTKKYLKYGRGQEEHEARDLDVAIKKLLDDNNISYVEILGDKDAPASIVKMLGL